jgi:hypothetical protein
MSNIRKIIQETFSYTTNPGSINHLHDDIVDQKGGKDVSKNPAMHPLEKYRKIIKQLMTAVPTEQLGQLENAIDFQALHRLSNKMAFAPQFMESLNTIKTHIETDPEGHRQEINDAWDKIKKEVPYWVLAQLPPKDSALDLPEDDKKALTNLFTVMEAFNKTAAKAGKELSSATEHASRDTQAKDNLDKARKDADMRNLDAGSDKKLSKPTKVEVAPKK